MLEGRHLRQHAEVHPHDASSNFGNVLSVLVASVFLPFLPMLPMQLLVQNLSTTCPSRRSFDRVDDELVTRPLHWDPASIGRFMVFRPGQFGVRPALFSR